LSVTKKFEFQQIRISNFQIQNVRYEFNFIFQIQNVRYEVNSQPVLQLIKNQRNALILSTTDESTLSLCIKVIENIVYLHSFHNQA
jgi:hypothetical protein